MAQQYGLGNAFADILGSYVQSRQINRRAQQDALNFDLRRQQLEDTRAYREQLQRNADRDYERAVLGDAWNMYNQNRQTDSAIELNKQRLDESKTSQAVNQIALDDDAATDFARDYFAEGAFNATTPPTARDLLDPTKARAFQALANNPAAISRLGGVVQSVEPMGVDENGQQLYNVLVYNQNTDSTGVVTSQRGTGKGEIVGTFTEEGLNQMLTDAHYAALSSVPQIVPQGISRPLFDARQGGMDAERGTVGNVSPPKFGDIRDYADNSDVLAEDVAANSQPSEAQAARLNQLGQIEQQLNDQVASQRAVLSQLDDTVGPQAPQYQRAAQTLGQLESQLQTVQQTIQSETPAPTPASTKSAAPAATTMDDVLQSSQDRVVQGAQTLAEPFLNAAGEYATQRNRAGAYVGNTNLTFDQYQAALAAQGLGYIQPDQASNIITYGDITGDTGTRVQNRFASGDNGLDKQLTNARSVVESANSEETTRLKNVLDAQDEARNDAITAAENKPKADQEQVERWAKQGELAAVAQGYDSEFSERVGANYAIAANSTLVNDPDIVGAIVSQNFVSQDLAPKFANMEKAIADFNAGSRTVSGQNLVERTITDLAPRVAGRTLLWGNEIKPQQTVHLTFLAETMGINPKDLLVKVIDPAVSATGNSSRLTPERLRAAILVTDTKAFNDIPSADLRNAEMVRLLSMPDAEFKELMKKLRTQSK